MKNYNDLEIPKYKKKSSTKHTSRSDHKHNYDDCLLVDNENRPYKANYCVVCGKIKDLKFWQTVRKDDNTYLQLDSDEVFKMFADLPTFKVVSCWDKYVILNDKEGSKMK